MKTKFIPVEESFKQWKKDPKCVAAYDALGAEFALASAMIKARADADMTQEQVAGCPRSLRRGGRDLGFFALADPTYAPIVSPFTGPITCHSTKQLALHKISLRRRTIAVVVSPKSGGTAGH